MIVVADTSPINYLVLIGEIDLLPALFKEVLIPTAVHRELTSSEAPTVTYNWATSPPNWLQINSDRIAHDRRLAYLDAGERAALELALHCNADAVLIDDYKGRQAALDLGINISGTLGILKRAADLKLVDFESALNRLLATNFRVSPAVLSLFLKSF